MDRKNTHVRIVTGHASTCLDIDKGDYVIAVDSGIRYLKSLNFTPDCLIGDLDSAAEADIQWAINNDVTVLKYPIEKDEVDTELALRHAYKQNPAEITIYNDMGGRFDHAMGLVYLLLNPLKKRIPCSIKSSYNQIYLVDTSMKIAACNAYVSILSFTPQAMVVATGLKYSMPEILYANKTTGISNEFTKEVAEIKVKRGIILLIVSKIV